MSCRIWFSANPLHKFCLSATQYSSLLLLTILLINLAFHVSFIFNCFQCLCESLSLCTICCRRICTVVTISVDPILPFFFVAIFHNPLVVRLLSVWNEENEENEMKKIKRASPHHVFAPCELSSLSSSRLYPCAAVIYCHVLQRRAIFNRSEWAIVILFCCFGVFSMSVEVLYISFTFYTKKLGNAFGVAVFGVCSVRSSHGQ